MSEFMEISLYGLGIMLLMGFATWIYSLIHNDVSIVDSLWSLMFMAAAFVYVFLMDSLTERNILLLVMISLWALRLSIFLTIRNWGKEEDRRYQEIRNNNQPNFRYKSLYIIFGLQALLAWVISIPFLFAFASDVKPGVIEAIAIMLWLTGFIFESVADYQLYRFKSNKNNDGRVLNTGLWAYSRHPNYFGEFLIWWGFYLFAFTAGAWWTIFSPLLMTILLLKVSGVSLMEKGITERRSEYRNYIETTNAFIPGKPRHESITAERG